MNVKLKNISKDWVDPDDAPELDSSGFEMHMFMLAIL